MDLDALHPFIAPHVRACPDPVIDHCIRQAAREFCQRTRVWRVTDTFPVTGGAEEIISVPAGAALVEIEDAWFNDIQLSPGRFALGAAEGEPAMFTQVLPNTLMVRPPGAGMLRLSLFVMPSLDAGQLPDFLVSIYAQPIASGALYRLLMIPGENWSNPPLGMAHRAEFDRAMDRNFAAHMKGQQRAPVRTKYRFI